MKSIAACTIISKNYVAYARVLAASFLEHHPGGRFFVLLVDRVDGAFDPSQELFTLIEVEQLATIPDLPSFLFKYDIVESNTAVKPYYLEYLFSTYDLDHIVFLDPDILIFQPLDAVAEAIEHYSITLIPHLTEPLEDDGKLPNEMTMLRVGCFNLGFLGLKATPTTQRMLTWWQKRLYEHCRIRFDLGLFVDQRWMDLVLPMFKDVFILKHRAYGVADWNLPERTITAGPPPEVNGQPLCFYHFSGIEIDNLEQISKHQTRYTFDEIGEAADLYHRYRALLIEAGHAESSRWPYAFGSLDNGALIEPSARHAYYELGTERGRFGDPFKSAGEQSFFGWLRSTDRVGHGDDQSP
jgi:hypothetical protein